MMPITIRRLAFYLTCCLRVAACQNITTGESNPSKPPLAEYIEEFFLSDAVRNQDKGELQLTLGVDFRRDLGRNSSLQMEYGVTNRLQLSLETRYGKSEEESAEASSEWNTASLGFQYQLIRSESPFALSVGMAFGIPVKAAGEIEYEPTILVARTFRRMQVHASFIAELEQWDLAFRYNVASVYPLRNRWFPTLEFNAMHLNGNGAFYLTPGLYRRFGHRLELGVGAPAGLGGTAAGSGIVGKISWEIEGDHRSR